MSRGKRYYRPIQPEPVNTPEAALANLRPQLEGALSAAEYFKGKDDITSRRHAEHAERLQTEIAKLEGAPMTTPPLDLPALRNDAEGWMLVSNIVDMEIPAPTVLALLDRAEAAEKAVAAVREAVEAHPKACDRHTEDDPIKCGWKRAVVDVTRALDSTPYQTLSAEPLVRTHHTPETETP